MLSQTSYNSRIVLTKMDTYYSPNYASTLGSSLITTDVSIQLYIHIKLGHIIATICNILLLGYIYIYIYIYISVCLDAIVKGLSQKAWSRLPY